MLPAAAYQPVRYNNLTGIIPPNYAIEDLRRFRTELSLIRDELNRHRSNDELSNQVTLWCNTFEGKLLDNVRKDIDLQLVIQNSIGAMQRIFRCSLPPFVHLDENALLGSDGKVYSSAALQHFRSQNPEPYRDRSPHNLDKPAILTTVPHPLASCIVRWFANYGVVLHAPVPPPQLNQLPLQPPPQPGQNNPLPAPDLEDDEEDILAEELQRLLQEARNGAAEMEGQPPQQEPELRLFEGELREHPLDLHAPVPPPRLNQLPLQPIPENLPAPQTVPNNPQPAPDLEDDEEDILAEELQRQLQEARNPRGEIEHQPDRHERELRLFEMELRAAAMADVERHEGAMHQIAERHHVNLDVVEERIVGLAARVFPAVNELRQANQRLAADTEVRRRETEELRNQLQRREGEIADLERSQAQLKIELNQLHEILNEREQERNDSLIKNIIIVVACVIICKLLPPASAAVAEALGLGGAGAAGAGAGAAATAAGTAAGAGWAGAGTAAGAAGAGTGAAAAGATIVPGLHVGVAPVTGGGKIGLFLTW